MRRRSSALEEERAAVEKQVEKDHHIGIVRKRSSYLPSSNSSNHNSHRLRDAKKAIQVEWVNFGSMIICSVQV